MTLELGDGRVTLLPSWDAGGSPSLAVRVSYRASVISSLASPSDRLVAELDEAFTLWLEERCLAALELCRSSGADFLDLGRLLKSADAAAFSRCGWPAPLETLPITLEVRGEVDRSFDILSPANPLED